MIHALALVVLQSPAAPAADVAALLEPIRAKHDVPGIVAAFVDADGVVAIGACGVRERGQPAALTTADRMHLGSCTKSMTATLCARLVEREKLAWTTTIGERFADWGDAVDAGWKPVTLTQLLTHRSGLPGDVDVALWAKLFTSSDAPRAQREQLARGVLKSPPKHAPGSKFEYANSGTAIAGLIAERAAGLDFEELMTAELFRPLKMERAGFGPPVGAKPNSEPVGHRADGTPVGNGPRSDNPPAIAPAGRVHAPLGDWARYAALHLRGEKNGGIDIRPETFVTLHTPAGDGYAMGWGVLERGWGGRVLTHSGSNTSWYCVAWLAPDKGFGVLVATNQGGDTAARACDDASGALIRAFTKKPEPNK